MKGTWVFTQTAAAGWTKRGGAESPELREALEELAVVEEVAVLVDMAAKGHNTIWKKGAAQGWRRAANQSDMLTAREGEGAQGGDPSARDTQGRALRGGKVGGRLGQGSRGAEGNPSAGSGSERIEKSQIPCRKVERDGKHRTP